MAARGSTRGPRPPAGRPDRWRTFGPPAATLIAGLVVTLVLALVSHAQYVNNERHLLKLRGLDAGAVVTAGIVPGVQTLLASAAELGDATNGSVQRFERFVAPDVHPASGGGFASMSLWRRSDLAAGPMAVAGAPPLLSRAAATQFLARTDGQLGVIGFLGVARPRLGFAFSAGRYLAYAEARLPPSRHSPVQSNSAFAGLDDAVYLGKRPRRQNLLFTSVAHLPLPGPTATTTVPLGTNAITVVLSSHSPLAGSLPQRLPWIIAGVGVLLSVAASLMTLRLTQRRRDAERLAGEVGRLAEEQWTIAQTLQHALLPKSLPGGRRLQASGHYQAGERGVDIGGDWYDVIELGERRLLLVIGDVSGRGLTAATTMASLRFAIRAYAVEEDSPAAILTKVSRLVNVADSGQLATILCALIDVDRRTISVTSAGHLPLLLVDGAGGHYLDAEVGVPVGVRPGAAYAERQVALPRDGTLVGFTDGLVETRGESIDDGLERLRSAAMRDGADLAELLGRLVSEVPGGTTQDDIAIVGVRWST